MIKNLAHNLKLSILKVKIILGFMILIIAVLLGGYFYLNKMTVVSGNININKTNTIDKLCNYSVYSDFYYRIVDYKSIDKNSYAELTPTRTDICYNFKTNKIDLNSYTQNEPIILDDYKADKMSDKLRYLENFQKDYSKIVATQDKDYFQKSYALTKETYYSLYQVEMPIISTNINSFYTNISDLPIDNLVVNYFNLSHIKQKPIKATKVNGWQPNILEWNFGESDKIYLQYLTKFKNIDLSNYIEDNYSKSNKIIIKFTKFNNNQLSKIFLIYDDSKNKIIVLFMDNNGYVYNLILKVQNKKAFKTYFNDFMKIAYGIYFTEKDNFQNKWVKDQNKIIEYYKEYKEIANKILIEDQRLREDYKCNTILSRYKETLEINNFIKNYKKLQKFSFDDRYKEFKKTYGNYPNKDNISKFNEYLLNIELINEGINKLNFPLSYLYSDKGCDVFKKYHKLKRIKMLKNNNWKEEI